MGGWIGQLTDTDENVSCILAALHHRGPDARNHRVWPDAGLVHARLSIIDLSPEAAQPLSNEDGSIWTVYNGEIYNHRELRRDLEQRGHQFRTHTDSEVIPHLYEEYGADFIHHLRGMFALAVYDVNRKTLVLARDRFGIKPLFYATTPDYVAFASEIRALRSLPGVDLSVDRQAVADYSALFYIPAPATLYEGIRALEPGKSLVLQRTENSVRVSERTYHQWRIAPDADLSFDEAVERASGLIHEATRSQLESDVPLGSLLSGGIDSSLVSQAAQSALTGKLRTFNVRFGEREYDETWAAEAVARHIGSEHQTLEMPNQSGTLDHVLELLKHAGQPFADSSLFAVNAVSKAMREHVTVALSGDGGDEGFGGYRSYVQLRTIAKVRKFPAVAIHSAAFAVGPLGRVGLVGAQAATGLRQIAGASDAEVSAALMSWIRTDEQSRLCRDRHVLPVSRLFEPRWQNDLSPRASALERLHACFTEANTRVVLPNDFLFKVDCASMHESLEVRVPMLDEELFGFAMTLPYGLKVKGKSGKRVLRRIAEKQLPLAVARKRKQGFGIPVDGWLTESAKDDVSSMLRSSSKLPDVFDETTYLPYIDAFSGATQHPNISRQGIYQRIVMLLAMHVNLT